MTQTQARRNTNNTQSSNTQQPLLAFRILGALPLVNSSYSLAKGVYLKTKENSEILKTGLDFAESSVLFASAPIVNRYEKLDHYASSKLNQLEDMYENRDKVVDNLAKQSLRTIRKVSYPVGFTIGLASQASNKALGLASPLIEKAFDYADEVVDNLMPADEPEDAAYLKMTVLQRKNPLRRMRQRTTLVSLLNLPSNSINYTAHLTLEAYHISALLADKFFYNLDRLLKLRSNIQYLSKISSAPFMLVFPSQRQKLYDFLKGDGFDYVNWSIEETLAKGEKMSEYLKKNGLPNNADLLDTALTGVKQLQGFLNKLVKGQPAIEARKEGAEKEEGAEKKERSAPAQSSSRRHIFNPEERPASFMTGDDATTEELANEQKSKSDAKEPVFDLPEILFEEKVDEEGFSKARPGKVGHNQKILPERVAHAKAPTTSASSHTAAGLVSNNPFAALLPAKAQHIQEKDYAAHVGRESLVVMDGTGNVAVAVAHEEPADAQLDSINQGETFFTEKDALEGWESVDNDRRHRRHHHGHRHAGKEEEKKVEEEKQVEKEEEEEPVSVDEHELVLKSEVGLVAIAHSEPLWSDSAADGEWQEPKKTFHHTTLQHEEKKAHNQHVHVDAQGNANPYALLQSQ